MDLLVFVFVTGIILGFTPTNSTGVSWNADDGSGVEMTEKQFRRLQNRSIEEIVAEMNEETAKERICFCEDPPFCYLYSVYCRFFVAAIK